MAKKDSQDLQNLLSVILDTTMWALYKSNAITVAVLNTYINKKDEILKENPAERIAKEINEQIPKSREGVVGL